MKTIVLTFDDASKSHLEVAVPVLKKYGFNAAEPNHIPWLVKKNRSREVLAAVAAWLDVNILRKRPKFPK